MKIKDILKGIVIALAAAYFFTIVTMFNSWGQNPLSQPLSFFIIIPLFGLLYSFWFVIPAGAVLGVLIPEIAQRYSRRTAVFYGLMLGVAVGVMGSLALSILFGTLRNGYWSDFISLLLTMSLYSAVWTGVYAYLCGKRSLKFS